MKKLKTCCVAVVIVGLVFAAACSKFEEGPAISLKSETKRITGNWELKSWVRVAQLNGDTTENYFFDGEYLHSGVNKAEFSQTYSIDEFGLVRGKSVINGDVKTIITNWQFKNLETYEDGVIFGSKIFDIMRFSKNEMFLEYSNYTVLTDSHNNPYYSTEFERWEFVKIQDE